MSLGTLFVVATPIGNLQDSTARALETLRNVDYIAAEDTRVTQKLLTHFSISKAVVRLDAHARTTQFKKILTDLQSGKSIAYVSDAGTPGISDPGAELVHYIAQHDSSITITPVPGASALTAALSISGFSFATFSFAGFPPAKKGRTNFFKDIACKEEVVVLYESVHRINRTLQELGDAIGERQIVVCRELTKQFETVYRGTVSTILDKGVEQRGEFVVIVGPSC